MIENFENLNTGPDKWMIAMQRVPLTDVQKNIQRMKEIRFREEYDHKIESLLDTAKTITNKKPKLTYWLGTHQFVCDTFIKYLFKKSGDHSLDGIYTADSLYKHFSPEVTNLIIPTRNQISFAVSGKQLHAWDLLFFTNNKGNCGHIAVFSQQDPETWEIYVYDAAKRSGVSERKLWPNELYPTYSKIYYTSPVFS